MSGMDVRRAPKADFTSTRGEVEITSDTNTGNYVLRVTKYVRVTGADAIGAVKFDLPLDPTMDNATEVMSRAYERWKMNNVRMQIQSASPLGTSSGGLQVAHFPDPLNANFIEAGDTGPNVDKFVRQSGSIFVRPRDSTEFKLDLNHTLFTKRSDSERFWSYGHIAACVRSVPDSTDFCEFTLTLLADIEFFRPAIVTAGNTQALETQIEEINVNDAGEVKIKLPLRIPAVTGKFQMEKPLVAMTRKRDGEWVVTEQVRITKFEATIEDKEITINNYDANMKYIRLLNNLQGTNLRCTFDSVYNHATLY